MPPARRAYSPKGFSEIVESEFSREYEQVIDLLASEQGPPSGAERVPESRRVALWGLRDRRVDPDLLRERLLTTGLGEEAQQMAVVQEYPEVLDVYANGVMALQDVQDPEALADDLVRFAEHPYRYALLADLAHDPEAMVREANRLERLWERQQGALAASRVATHPSGSASTRQNGHATMDEDDGSGSPHSARLRYDDLGG